MSRCWWYPPRDRDFRIESQPPALYGRWFQTWVCKLRNRHTGEPIEERCISIKLPIWGIYYSINVDDERWGQLTFQYRGQRGCFFVPVFPPEASNG